MAWVFPSSSNHLCSLKRMPVLAEYHIIDFWQIHWLRGKISLTCCQSVALTLWFCCLYEKSIIILVEMFSDMGWSAQAGFQLPGGPDRVTLSVRMIFCYVNVSRWGNPPSRGRTIDNGPYFLWGLIPAGKFKRFPNNLKLQCMLSYLLHYA